MLGEFRAQVFVGLHPLPYLCFGQVRVVDGQGLLLDRLPTQATRTAQRYGLGGVALVVGHLRGIFVKHLGRDEPVHVAAASNDFVKTAAVTELMLPCPTQRDQFDRLIVHRHEDVPRRWHKAPPDGGLVALGGGEFLG